MKTLQKALDRAFFYLTTIFLPFFIALGYLWSVQSPLETSFNNQFVYYLTSFASISIFIFWGVKFEIYSFSIYLFANLIAFISNVINDDYFSNYLIFFIYSSNCLLFFSVAKTAKTEVKKKILDIFMMSLLMASSISTFIVIYQWLGLANTDNDFGIWIYPAQDIRLSANLAQPNNLSTLICTGVCSVYYLFFEKKCFFSKSYLISFVFLFSISIFLTGSRTGYLALSIFGIYFWIKKKNIFLAFLPLISLLFIKITYPEWAQYSGLSFPELAERGMNSGRYLIWEMALNAISQSPWIGHGVGNGISVFLKIIPYHTNYAEASALSSAHNVFLDIAISLGLPFALILIFLTVKIVIKSIKNNDELIFYAYLGMVPIFIHALLEFPQNYSYFIIPFFVFLGISQSNKESPPVKITNQIPFILFFIAITSVTLLYAREFNKIDIFYKKLRLQTLSVDVPSPYTGNEKCRIDSYCDFLFVHLLDEKEIDENENFQKKIKKIADNFPTPFTLENGIILSIKLKNYAKAKEQIINYCLIFTQSMCNNIEAKIKGKFSQWNEFLPQNEINEINLRHQNR